MGRMRIKKKKKGGGDPTVKIHAKVRLTRDEALHMMNATQQGKLADAEKWLAAMRPKLDADTIYEVALRCSDPQRHGGIETGTAPGIGDYADIAITGLTRPVGRHR